MAWRRISLFIGVINEAMLVNSNKEVSYSADVAVFCFKMRISFAYTTDYYLFVQFSFSNLLHSILLFYGYLSVAANISSTFSCCKGEGPLILGASEIAKPTAEIFLNSSHEIASSKILNETLLTSDARMDPMLH